MKERIEKKLKEAGISTQGCYASLPGGILSAIETVKIFGYEYWEQHSTYGFLIKQIVKDLSK